MAAAIIPDGMERVLSRPMRGLYTKRKRPLQRELKSVEMSAGERIGFAEGLSRIAKDRPDVHFCAITVCKTNVNPAFRAHPNGLYNYMAKLLLLDIMGDHETVCFIPDARSLKTEFKHAMHDYLRTELAVRGAATRLQTTPWESRDCLPLQFTDVLAGIVWAHHEFGNSEPYRISRDVIRQRTLFFPRAASC